MNLRPAVAVLSFLTIPFFTFAQNENQKDTSLVQINDSSKVFEKVETEASFPGGEMGWRNFLQQNLKADVPAQNGAPAGKYTVWVQFIVDSHGNVADVKSLTNNGYGMEKEVERIIKIGPPWQPASQNGRNVKAYRKQPVTFVLEDDGFEITSQEEYVFYIGMDNPITITARNVKPKDLTVIISQGTIIPKDDGNFIVRVNKPGRVILHLYKRNKEIGAASFEVKPKDKAPKVPMR